MKTDWKPIETATKDGTLCLIWLPKPYCHPEIGKFMHRSSYKPGEKAVHTSGWVVGEHHDFGSYMLGKHAQPTHWMPLPEPPKPAKIP